MRSLTSPRASAYWAPAGRICRPCRRTLDEFLGTLETFGRTDRSREPAQTLAFRRVLQTAVLHVQSAGKDEVRSGDVLAAIVKQPKAYAAEVLEAQGVTRLDILNYISHGISKVPRITGDTESQGARAEAGAGEEGPADGSGIPCRRIRSTCRRELARGSSIPSSGGRPSCGAPWRSSAGAGRTTPSSSARPASARPRSPRGWRRGCSRTTSPRPWPGRRSSPSTRPRSSPERASGAISRNASRRSSPPSPSGRCRSSSSTRCTPPWEPAPPRAARWTWPP